MKTAQDPRHKSRIERIQSLFAYSFSKPNNLSSNYNNNISQIIEQLPTIDKLIQKAAPEWPLTKINKIDLSILRLSVYEILYENDIPIKVSIDEAVEIAKEFGAENSPAFVNGVLGTIVKEKGLQNDDEITNTK